MAEWKDVSFEKMVLNVDEAALRRAAASIENSFINDSGGHTRFPGLTQFADLTGESPTYLAEFQSDLFAASNGRLYRINKAGTATDVTGVPIGGPGRVMFDKTEAPSLLMAAGAQILKFNGTTTSVLSLDAPESTHVGVIDGYVLAIEKNTGLFYHSALDGEGSWDPLDVFAANGRPDNLNALLITPFREILMTGVDSVELFQPLPQGSTPFYRRYATGEGVYAPYTLIAEDQGAWAINGKKEFVRLSGQSSVPRSDDVGKAIVQVDDWNMAWAASLSILGQKFILLQAPYASNGYGTEGLTGLYDYRQKKWYLLYGWENGAPARWPGWSYLNLWGRHFVGGNGKVLELVTTTHTNDGAVQRMLGRTAHIDAWGDVGVINVRVRIKRGVSAQNAGSALFGLRAKRDNKTYTAWNWKSLGEAGDTMNILEYGPMGSARAWQWEWMITDDVPVELVRMQVQIEQNEQS